MKLSWLSLLLLLSSPHPVSDTFHPHIHMHTYTLIACVHKSHSFVSPLPLLLNSFEITAESKKEYLPFQLLTAP